MRTLSVRIGKTTKTIYPGEVAHIKLFKVIRPVDKPMDLICTLEIPLEECQKASQCIKRVSNSPVMPSNIIPCIGFLCTYLSIELKILCSNSCPIIFKLDVENMKKALREHFWTKPFRIL